MLPLPVHHAPVVAANIDATCRPCLNQVISPPFRRQLGLSVTEIISVGCPARAEPKRHSRQEGGLLECRTGTENALRASIPRSLAGRVSAHPGCSHARRSPQPSLCRTHLQPQLLRACGRYHHPLQPGRHQRSARPTARTLPVYQGSLHPPMVNAIAGTRLPSRTSGCRDPAPALFPRWGISSINLL